MMIVSIAFVVASLAGLVWAIDAAFGEDAQP